MTYSREQLFGHWQAVAGILANTPMADDIVSATKLTLGEDFYEVDLAGNIDRGTAKIQHEGTPVKLEIHGTDGPNAGRTFLAILKFVTPDQIRIAYDLSGAAYPATFDPTAEKTSYIATFERC